MESIEVFTDAHIERALSLWRTSDAIGLSEADEPSRLSAFLRRNPGLSFVALDGGRLIGACLCGHDGRRGYVHHLAVDPGSRRVRLASRLLDRCLAALLDAGIQKCHAFVFRSNPYAGLFWEPKGWERRDDLIVYSSLVPARVERGIERGRSCGFARPEGT